MIATQSQLIHMNTEIYDFQVGHTPLMKCTDSNWDINNLHGSPVRVRVS